MLCVSIWCCSGQWQHSLLLSGRWQREICHCLLQTLLSISLFFGFRFIFSVSIYYIVLHSNVLWYVIDTWFHIHSCARVLHFFRTVRPSIIFRDFPSATQKALFTHKKHFRLQNKLIERDLVAELLTFSLISVKIRV